MDENGTLVPLTVAGQRIYLAVRETDSEEEIAWQPPTLEDALDGVIGIARAVGARLRETSADKASVEFGCEFALESGKLATVIGKASGKSTFKVLLEWNAPDT